MTDIQTTTAEAMATITLTIGMTADSKNPKLARTQIIAYYAFREPAGKSRNGDEATPRTVFLAWQIRKVIELKRNCLLRALLPGITLIGLATLEVNAGTLPPREDRIDQLIARYGVPTRMSKQRNKFAYHWQLKASVVFENDGLSRSEEFQCNVTAIATPRGRLIRVSSDVRDAGAGVLAAVGAFGRLCKSSFGIRPGRL